MIKNVEEYLAQLKKELSGCDKATVQDALSDAEEYLRTALENDSSVSNLSREEALQSIIEKYGFPEEIAAEYRETEKRITPALVPEVRTIEKPGQAAVTRTFSWKQFFTVFTDPLAWGSFLYLLLSLATGILYFTWVVTGLSVSAGLLVLIIGLPVLAGFILSVRGMGLVEGRIVEALLGVRMPRRQRFSRSYQGWWDKLKGVFSDKQTWFTVIYMLLMLPLGIIYFTLMVSFISTALWSIAVPFIQMIVGTSFMTFGSKEFFLAVWAYPLTIIGGILLLFVTMNLARFLGILHGKLARVMLVRA